MRISSGKNNNTIKEQLSLLAEPAYRGFCILPASRHGKYTRSETARPLFPI